MRYAQITQAVKLYIRDISAGSIIYVQFCNSYFVDFI